MKKFWKWAGIAILVAILGAGAVGAVALAQGTGTTSGGPFDFQERFRQAIASILGISVETYDKAVEQARDQVLNEAVSEGWLTQDQADRMRERMELGPGFGPWGKGRGFGPWGKGRGFGWKVDLISVAAEKLGMSVSDLAKALRDGKSIAEVAQEKGVEVQTIADAYIAKLEEQLKKAVADGQLGQKMADWMLQQAREQVNSWLEQTWPAPFPGMPRWGRWGGGFWNCPCTSSGDSGGA